MSGPAEPEKLYADKTVDEVIGDVPLFMNSLNYSDESAPVLDALQSLAYDGEPWEIADQFKSQANEFFKEKQYKQAIQFYSNALDQVGSKIRAEQRRVLWNNRAAAHFELGNLRSSLNDLGRVLSEHKPDDAESTWDKTTQKAYFRSAKALLALDKPREALDVLKRFEAMDDKENPDPAAKIMMQQANAKLESQLRSARERRERDRRKTASQTAVLRALHVMGIIVPNPNFLNETPAEVVPVHFDPDEVPAQCKDSIPLVPTSAYKGPKWEPCEPTVPLIFPVTFSLPLEDPPRRDLCIEFHSEVLLGYALEQFGLPPSTYDYYIVTTQGRAFKGGPNSTLQKLARNAYRPGDALNKADGWALIENGGLELFVLPKSESAKEWLAEHKAFVKG